MDRKIATVYAVRGMLFVMAAFFWYMVLVTVAIPTIYGLGEVRALVVGVMARVTEEGMYRALRMALSIEK